MIKKILEKVTEMMKPHSVYLCGGAVRDYLMGNIPHDYDFCTPTEPDEIERLIKESGKRAYLTGKRYGTLGCKIEIDGKFHMVEITTFRSETYKSGDRKPDVKYVKSLHEDLSRRDFTIGAIAMRLTKGHLRIIDPFCGQEDIENKTLKCVGHPKQRFKEDPLRILRCIRFVCKLGFTIEPETLKKMKRMAICILDISKERWVMELDQILQSDNVGLGLRLLWDCNLFKYMIPEIALQYNFDQNSEYHDYTLDEHTIKVVEAVRKDTDDLNLLWAALLHDCMKPGVRTDKEVIVKSEDNEKDYLKTKSNYVGHERLAAETVDKYALYLKWSKDRHQKVRDLVLNHLKEDSPLRKYDNLCKNKNG